MRLLPETLSCSRASEDGSWGDLGLSSLPLVCPAVLKIGQTSLEARSKRAQVMQSLVAISCDREGVKLGMGVEANRIKSAVNCSPILN